MKRRNLLALLGGAAAFPRLASAAEPKLPVIGVLVAGRPDPTQPLRFFRDGLKKLGYVEGENIRLEIRNAEGNADRLPALAGELVRDRVDIIVAWMTPVITVAKRTTNTIPIVMMGAGDPVGTGIIASLAGPGGNITGMAGQTAELAGKLVEFLKEMMPTAHRIAALCNAPDPFSKPFLEQIRLAGKAEGMRISPYLVKAGPQLDGAFPAMAAAKIDAAIVQPSLPAKHVAKLAIRQRLPAASPGAGFAKAGGLLAYIVKPQSYYGRAAVFVDEILKGAKPADLPVEQSTEFEMAINLKTAKALGLTIPPSLLARADEVIQ